MPNLNNLPVLDIQWGTALWSGLGYIDGLTLVWNSANSISVSSGSAYVPSLSRVLPSPNTLTLSGLSLQKSSFYHVYLYGTPGAPAIECVNISPTVYSGTACYKSGDTSRRYIGSVLTDTNGNIWNFAQNGSDINYQVIGGQSPFRLVAGATNTAAATANASTCIPVTSRLAILQLYNFDTPANGGANMCTATSQVAGSGSGNNGMYLVRAQSTEVFPQHPLDQNQCLTYWFSQQAASGSGGMYIDVFGYTYER